MDKAKIDKIVELRNEYESEANRYLEVEIHSMAVLYRTAVNALDEAIAILLED